jgi:type IV pilus assembly protein PilO
MANLRVARRNLYAIAAILIVVDVIALIILLSPVGAISAAKQDEFQQLRQEVQAKTRKVVPPDQVQQRVDEARKQIAQFIQERVPAQASDFSVELGKLASDAGVRLGSVRYEELDSEVPGLRRFRISATVSGEYVQEVKFINALERSKHFYVINSVNLGEQQQGAVRLGLNVDTYLKEGQ